jgi:hypothetical protein
MHDDCRAKQYAESEAKRLAAATLIPDYTGPFIVGGRFFGDIESLLDRFADDELPVFGFCLEEKPAHIDISNILESVADDMHEDWEEIPCEELEVGISAWNKANEGNGSYFEDDNCKWSRDEVLKIWRANGGRS